MKRITPGDLLEAAEAVARVTGQSHIFIVGMASTVHSLPSLSGMLTDDVDLFTPDAETCFWDEVIASLGEGGPFDARHGFYVERPGSWVLLTQPHGWMEMALLMPHPQLTIRNSPSACCIRWTCSTTNSKPPAKKTSGGPA
jgi:hypothetical protein